MVGRRRSGKGGGTGLLPQTSDQQQNDSQSSSTALASATGRGPGRKRQISKRMQEWMADVQKVKRRKKTNNAPTQQAAVQEAHPAHNDPIIDTAGEHPETTVTSVPAVPAVPVVVMEKIATSIHAVPTTSAESTESVQLELTSQADVVAGIFSADDTIEEVDCVETDITVEQVAEPGSSSVAMVSSVLEPAVDQSASNIVEEKEALKEQSSSMSPEREDVRISEEDVDMSSPRRNMAVTFASPMGGSQTGLAPYYVTVPAGGHHSGSLEPIGISEPSDTLRDIDITGQSEEAIQNIVISAQPTGSTQPIILSNSSGDTIKYFPATTANQSEDVVQSISQSGETLQSITISDHSAEALQAITISNQSEEGLQSISISGVGLASQLSKGVPSVAEDSVRALHTSEGQVQLMLSNDDSVTQALLESFMAENSGEGSVSVSAAPPDVSPQSPPREHEIAPNVKLTEHVQIDEQGRKQTVLYLSTADGTTGSTLPLSTAAVTSTVSTATNQLALQSEPGYQEETVIADTGASNMAASQEQTGDMAELSTIKSKQQVCTLSADGQLSGQDVVIEVYVNSAATGEDKIRGVTVMNPYPYISDESGLEVMYRYGEQAATVYKCSECDYRSEKRCNILKHSKKSHEEKAHACTYPDCTYTARTQSNLKRHILSHTDERKFPCDQCNQRFKQKIHLEKHINYIHKEKRVKCEFCDYVCANRVPDLKLHMKRKHLKNDPDDPPTYLECEKCGFLAGSKKDLKQHFKFHKRGPELKLFCEHCSFVTDAKSRLERHSMTHTKEKPFSCSLCDYSASQKEHINRHMRTRHKGLTGGEVDVDKMSTVDISQLTDEAHEEEIVTSVICSTDSGANVDGDASATQDVHAQEALLIESVSRSPELSHDQEESQRTGHDQFNVPIVTANTSSSDQEATPLNDSGQLEEEGSEDQLIIQTALPEQESLYKPLSARQIIAAGTTAATDKSSSKTTKYEPPDYSQKAKSFACTHCTMKFVRLLSLYKHLHTQHSDLLPNTEEEKLTCVVCDFKAQSHKALLVHMRKHNSQDTPEEQEEPGMLYVCVLCKYMNSKRRNLYQHLKKKHKLSIIVKKDGTASCVVEPNAEVTVVSSSQGQQVTEVVGLSAADGGLSSEEPSKVVNILDLADSLTRKHDISHLIQRVEIGSVHLQPEQAAAEAIVDLATQTVIQEEEVLPTSSAILEADENGHGKLQIPAQQLHSLCSGDFIEINGETYKVELQGDTMTAVLCVPQVMTHAVPSANEVLSSGVEASIADELTELQVVSSDTAGQVPPHQLEGTAVSDVILEEGQLLAQHQHAVTVETCTVVTQ